MSNDQPAIDIANRWLRERGEPLAAASRAAHLGVIRRFFSFLYQRRWILRNPSKELAVPSYRRLPGRGVLTLKQAERLMNAPERDTVQGLRDRAILELFYGTGIRLSECRRLDVADVDLERQTLFIRNGKGKKDRIVPVPARAAEALDRHLTESRPWLLKLAGELALFLSLLGRRLSQSQYHTWLRRYGKAARTEKPVSPHGLRQ